MSKNKYPNINTPICLASWPHLLEPNLYVPPGGSPEPGDKGAYSCTLKLDPEDPEHADFIQKLNARADQLHADYEADNGKKVKQSELFYPVQPEEDKDGEETGLMLIKANQRAGGIRKSGPKQGEPWEFKISVYDHAGNIHGPAPEGKSLGNGSRIRLELEVGVYVKDKRMRTSLKLRCAQIVVPEWYDAKGSGAFAGEAVDPETFDGYAAPLESDGGDF